MLRKTGFLLLFVATALAAGPPKVIAPEVLAHPTAMFLASLCGDGRHTVTFKAAAMGTHFFFEESSGVTVYSFDGHGYRKLTFLKGYTISRAIKRFTR
jgi:hypothetical protein